VYDLALATYAIALWHFGSEALVYRTVGLRGLAGPLVVSSASCSPSLSPSFLGDEEEH